MIFTIGFNSFLVSTFLALYLLSAAPGGAVEVGLPPTNLLTSQLRTSVEPFQAELEMPTQDAGSEDARRSEGEPLPPLFASYYFLLFLALIGNVGAAITSFVAWRMYRARLRVEGSEVIQVPERLIEDTNLVIKGNDDILAQFRQFNAELDEKLNIFETMQTVLVEKDKEISHLKGEDQIKTLTTFAKSLTKVMRHIRRDIETNERENVSNADLESVHNELLEILAENGFSLFEIPLGTDYRETGEDADNRGKFISTDDPSKDWTVVKTRLPGLHASIHGQLRVIERAIVDVYRLKEL